MYPLPSRPSLLRRATWALTSGVLAAGALVAVPSHAEETNPQQSAPAEASAARPRTQLGSTVFERRGESSADAYTRVRRSYGGRLGAVRVFFPGLPSPWSRLRHTYGGAPLVVSFRADPGAVLRGRYDRQLRKWFRSAPKNRTIRWSYMHEPEDDAERGQLRPRQYRRAWRHVERLADSARNRHLRSTLILMCWTLEPNSGRNWRAYYPGDRVIDVLGFDCYNAGHEAGRYRSPRELLKHAAHVSRRTGNPWGVAELGSVVVRGDNGRGRARWLRGAVKFARKRDARFITYFNSDVGVDYRLRDRPSRRAWRRLVSSQFR